MSKGVVSVSPLKVVKNDTYSTLNLVGRADVNKVNLLQSTIPELTDSEAKDVIVNCQHLDDLNIQLMRGLVQLQAKLKDKKRQMRLIYVRPEIMNFLKREGVEKTLLTSLSLHTALIDLGIRAPRVLDVNFINPFLTATINVLETQTNTKATPGQLYKRAPTDKLLGDVSGIIGLITEAFSGSVVISFPAPTFLKIMSRMLGEEFTTLTKEIQDGAGEMTNIIFGHAKVKLNEQGFGIKTALPSVVSGNDHSIFSMSSGPRVVVPFETDVGPFFIEICLSA